MNQLLLISLGPVQDFIAAARRTRDLWFGSHLLSELSRAGAIALADKATLIMPTLDPSDPNDQPHLTICKAPLTPTGEPPRNIANKLLAEVPEGCAPEKLAQEVWEAIQKVWRDFAGDVQQKCKTILASQALQPGGGGMPGAPSPWEEQMETLLEFYAVWTPLEPTYKEARERLEQELASRKNLREFMAWQSAAGPVPKSSLDGIRGTVLSPNKQDRRSTIARRLRIAEGEQLDAIGLIKRAGGEPHQFIPLVNVAYAAWLKQAKSRASDEFSLLRDACEGLYNSLGLKPLQHRDLRWVERFPYDAHLFNEERWEQLFEEMGLPQDDGAWCKKFLHPLLKGVRLILEKARRPSPYVACLVADGDRMGAALDTLDNPDAHRIFSRHLSDFAAKARPIVEKEYCGILVYAGGDDVLAFVCLSDALSCARRLHQVFATIMENALPDTPKEKRPTLSVGVGIGHVLESMGHLLSLGRRAEKLAKSSHLKAEHRDRNALAILLDKRSGGEVSWRAQWSEWDDDPVARLEQDVGLLHAQQLSSKKVYEVRADLLRMPIPDQLSANESAQWAALLPSDVRRTLRRQQMGADNKTTVASPEEAGLIFDHATSYDDLHHTVTTWTERLMIARTLNEAGAFRSVPEMDSGADK